MTISISGTTLTFNDATTQTTAASSAFPAGTVVLFYQAAAPTGWTQVTSLNDYDLRLVSGTGGGTGGTTAYSTVFTNQTVSVSGTTGSTTLSTAQMPSHTHSVPRGGLDFANYGGGESPSTGSAAQTTGAEGGGGSHNHSFSGSGSVTLNVRYANIIICSKN